ncbi:rhomboid family intramembrane serine protease [Clostridium chromiireducens]|uniref:Rhomboid family intramembrane serine protease n=1 Tax=Clostridium chromiireducens TaxID=225345 RepID=A0A399ITA7_9CLOT|nr:rhomboid family intramembrane serine protease [Clostridium chromiireducens]RII36234.1 rhomboid family intramembrane serine protease [Clostridium chromiireducens]
MIRIKRDEIYKILLDRENFYMKQYYSNFHKKEIFLAIKELKDGIYCILICDEENEQIDCLEAVQYIKTLGKAFSLNMIILSDKEEYTHADNSPMANKLVINRNRSSVIYCDNSCIPIRHIFENANHEKNVRGEEKFFKDKSLTLILMGINIIVFLLTAFLSGNFIDIDSKVLLYFGAKYNILIQQGQFWRLLTCAFLHSGLIHIACNMYSLYIIGPQIQQVYGTYRYFIVYIFSCIAASILSYIMSPNSLSVGASGGIFGLIGALLAFAIIERNRINKNYISSLIQIIIINLFIGLSIKNIDNFAHVGGLIGGITAGYITYRTMRKYNE